MQLSRTLKIIPIDKVRASDEAKSLSPQSVRYTSLPFNIRLMPHIMNPLYASLRYPPSHRQKDKSAS